MIMDNISILKAEADDWEPAMELAWRTFLKYEANDYSREGVENFLNFISDEKLYKMFLEGCYVLYVAKEGDKIVGIVSLRAGNHISLLFVDQAYHRKSIGRELLVAIQKSIKSDGVVQMTVNAAPYAVGFYEKVGFLKIGGMLETDGITYQPMKIMGRVL